VNGFDSYRVRERADIARALRAEGHAQLLQAFLIHATIVDAAARLKAMGQAYVEFGLANPETYRLMFMETSGAAALADPGDADPNHRHAVRLTRVAIAEDPLGGQFLTPAKSSSSMHAGRRALTNLPSDSPRAPRFTASVRRIFPAKSRSPARPRSC